MRDYRKRKVGIRKPYRFVVIICEGEKTEILYFKNFNERYSGVKVEPLHKKCTDAKNIVKFAEQQIAEYSLDLDEGDGIWCAFDVDEKTNSQIKDAISHAKTKEIGVALSNPSFELWYLLHYKSIFASITRENVNFELKKYIKNYSKNTDVFNLLSPNQSNAIKNAENLNRTHFKNQIDLESRESNPSTQVFQLVNFIQALIKKNKS
jgi:hypothetical protein